MFLAFFFLFFITVVVCRIVRIGFSTVQVFEEKAYLVGVGRKGSEDDSFSIEESLKELAQLADTAGLMVVGSTYQK